jgi:hypothetical protein
MKLTEENKETIDSMSYYDLLSHWRFAPPGDPWFEGETGKYWAIRMQEMKEKDPDPVGVSKAIG